MLPLLSRSRTVVLPENEVGRWLVDRIRRDNVSTCIRVTRGRDWCRSGAGEGAQRPDLGELLARSYSSRPVLDQVQIPAPRVLAARVVGFGLGV